MRLLVDHRARRVAPAVRPAARSGWLRRWWGILSVAVQHATALGCDCWRHPWQPAGDDGPPLADVLDLAESAAPSRLPWAKHVSPRASVPKKACGKKKERIGLMGKLTISMVIFNSKLLNYQMVCLAMVQSHQFSRSSSFQERCCPPVSCVGSWLSPTNYTHLYLQSQSKL